MNLTHRVYSVATWSLLANKALCGNEPHSPSLFCCHVVAFSLERVKLWLSGTCDINHDLYISPNFTQDNLQQWTSLTEFILLPRGRF